MKIASGTSHLDDLLRPKRELMIVVWLAFTATLGVYALIASVITGQLVPGEAPTAIGIGARVLALLLGAASLLLPRKLLTTDVIIKQMNVEPDLQALASDPMRMQAVDDERLRTISALPRYEQRLLGLTRVMWKPFVLGLALSESVGLLGLVLSLLSHNLFAGLPLLAAALVLNVLQYPKLGPVLELGLKAQRARSDAALDQGIRQYERNLSQRPGSQRPPSQRPPSGRPQSQHPPAVSRPQSQHPPAASRPQSQHPPARSPSTRPPSRQRGS